MFVLPYKYCRLGFACSYDWCHACPGYDAGEFQSGLVLRKQHYCCVMCLVFAVVCTLMFAVCLPCVQAIKTLLHA